MWFAVKNFAPHIEVYLSVFITFLLLGLQECQKDLVSVIPMLQNAIQSLNTLEKADISEVK